MAALGRAGRALLRPRGDPAGRRGVRALRRSPVRVLQPQSPRQSPQSPAERPQPPAAVERSAAAPGLWYEKAAPGDRRLGKVVTIAKSKKFRDNNGKVLLEGHRLIKDALEAGAVPQTLFFSTVGHLKLLPEAEIKRASLVKVKFEDIKTWSDLVTPQGLLGIFSKPDPAKMSYPAAQLASSLPLLLICDNIRDPGNLGTILRSAAGAGCEKVLLTKGCVDPWEPKVLRAGMGAHFRVPIITNLDWESVPTKLPAGIQVCVADNNPSAPAGTTSVPRGADRAGSAPASSKAPVKPSPEDLMLQPPEHEGEEGAAGIPELAAQHYYEDWARAPVAVVIGGETHGLSPAALRLAASTGGKRLVIPVVPGVDSLNSAIAAGIMLFEGKRQLLWRHKQEDDRHKLPVPG
ncbi:PREDICTED: rRNA methyltransferase 3, mitochondrial [Pseudopodoces humilis]|uniref:rRNA methyltransferase 3, mitochondrial n=1 Tax=Pseudopodoces humilis TaxID=181119 RepID=UPI0006B7ED48|nr:PREDICTED: rRNA methyltransferase 3, mitochondrial [Pseudopodoces humilis]